MSIITNITAILLLGCSNVGNTSHAYIYQCTRHVFLYGNVGNIRLPIAELMGHYVYLHPKHYMWSVDGQMRCVILIPC